MKFKRRLFLGIIAVTLFAIPDLHAVYSKLDENNRLGLEKKAADLRKKVEIAKSELQKQEELEQGAYMKNAKGWGQTRSQKIDGARDFYEATKLTKSMSKKYEDLKRKYEILKKRLNQVEWELEQLESQGE